jgi:hypothetical protein
MISEGFVTNGAKVYISSRDVKACEQACKELNALGAFHFCLPSPPPPYPLEALTPNLSLQAKAPPTPSPPISINSKIANA